MSSSAEAGTGLDWSAFSPRDAGAPAELRSPASELAAALQHAQRVLGAERETARRDTARWLEMVAEQAALVHQLGVVVARTEEALLAAGSKKAHQQLRIVRDRMLAALADAGLEVVDPTGRSFDEVVEQVEVIGWRNGPQFPAEVVAETVEPIVLHDNALVRLGRVIMGAPEENRD